MPGLPRQNVGTEQELIDCQAQLGEQPEPIREVDEELSRDEDAIASTAKPPSPLIHLQIPVPPMLEAALGYEGNARYVAFYWQPAGDEVMYDDGQVNGDGDWWAWVEFENHRTVISHLWLPCPWCDGVGTTNQLESDHCDFCHGAGLLPINLGSSDFEADHWLILDRQERQLYVAPVATARRFLQEQWPPLPELAPEEEQSLLEAIQKAVEELHHAWHPPSSEELEARLIASMQLCKEMVAWLDGQVEEEE
jgi:hypothetical protein